MFKILTIVCLIAFIFPMIQQTQAWRRRRRCDTSSCSWHWGPCTTTNCHDQLQRPVVTRSQGPCGSCNLPEPRSCSHPDCKECVWNNWSQWSQCPTNCSLSEVFRSRTKRPFGSKVQDCTGPNIETKVCGKACCPVDCQWSEWTKFGLCSKTCGSGQESRSRSIKVKAQCGGAVCEGSDVDTRRCNTQCCAVDCQWSEWGDFEECSVSCGRGKKSRSRTVQVAASCGGELCQGSSTSTLPCNTQCCAVDCKWTNWSEFGSCSKTCGSGTQSRQRQIATTASCHGKSCQGANNDTRSCNTECCKVDCSWTDWTAWQECNATCGTGMQKRFRKIKVEASCGGDVCDGERVQISHCNTHCCPVDCQVSQWSSWTSCTKSCGVSGFTTRNRNITQQQSCEGKVCPNSFEQVKPCNVICFNNGTPDASTQTCQCSKGWKGECCDEDVDECKSNLNNCNDVATCTNFIGSFQCSCNQGYSGNGVFCINDNECEVNTGLCHDDAICTDTLGSYICTCANGYHGNGTVCKDVDECKNDEHKCDVNANCFNVKGHYECLCKEGYKEDGLSCFDINECEENQDNCNGKAKCINTDGSFQCKCLDGYTGDGITCSDVDECEEGTNNCSSEADCNNLEGSFTCICKNGYKENSSTCIDLDECLYELDDCNFNAVCINTIGSYKCTCNSGYQENGYNCSDLVKPFEKSYNCSPNSICLNYQRIISNTIFVLIVFLIFY